LDTGWVAKGKLDPVGRLTAPNLSSHSGADKVHTRRVNDKKHTVEAVEECVRLFGHAPKAYAYDRGGYSERNIKAVAALGVKQVGIAPCGQAPWAVHGAVRKKIKRNRVTVEGSIGALKSSRYCFSRPNVRSTEMMMTCGHRSILGYNLNRLLSHVATSEGIAMVG